MITVSSETEVDAAESPAADEDGVQSNVIVVKRVWETTNCSKLFYQFIYRASVKVWTEQGLRCCVRVRLIFMICTACRCVETDSAMKLVEPCWINIDENFAFPFKVFELRSISQVQKHPESISSEDILNVLYVVRKQNLILAGSRVSHNYGFFSSSTILCWISLCPNYCWLRIPDVIFAQKWNVVVWDDSPHRIASELIQSCFKLLRLIETF